MSAGIVAGRTPREYQADALLMVNQPKLVDSPSVLAAAMRTFATFPKLFFNRRLADAVVKKFSLDRPPLRLEPDGLLARLNVDEVPGTSLIRLHLRLPSAELAANALNTFCDEAIALNRRFNQNESVAVSDLLHAELEHARERLREADAALLDYRQTARAALVKQDTDAMLDQRGQLLNLLVQIESEKARLAKAEQEIAKRDRVLSVKRGAEFQPSLEGVADSELQMRPELGSEFMNPVYEILDTQIATTRTRLAALERQREEMLKVLNVDAAPVGKLADLYMKQDRLARLQLDQEMATKLFSDLYIRYEQARVDVAARTAELQVVERAAVPSQPESRHVGPIAAGTGALAFFFLALGSLVHHKVRHALRVTTVESVI